MSAGAPAKMLANKQLKVLNSNGTIHSYMTLKATMAVVNYARCDTLIPPESALVENDIHYKVNLSQTIGGANWHFVMVELTDALKVTTCGYYTTTTMAVALVLV